MYLESISCGLEELHWQLYAYLASFGVVFSFLTNDHVRLDLFRHRFSRKKSVGHRNGWSGLFRFSVFHSSYVAWISGCGPIIFHWRTFSETNRGSRFTFIVKLALPLSFSIILIVAISAAYGIGSGESSGSRFPRLPQIL